MNNKLAGSIAGALFASIAGWLTHKSNKNRNKAREYDEKTEETINSYNRKSTKLRKKLEDLGQEI